MNQNFVQTLKNLSRIFQISKHFLWCNSTSLYKHFILLFFLTIPLVTEAQTCSDVTVVENINLRENGNIDYTIIGNTQNPYENNDNSNNAICNGFAPNLVTDATLTIPTGDNIRSAYLYWSGTGPRVDNVTLNNTSVSADRCWTHFDADTNLDFFSATADVTSLVQSNGAGLYTFSGLDNSSLYNQFRCPITTQDSRFALLYGGWALYVIFENPSYNECTIFLFDGFREFQEDSFNVVLQTNIFDDFENSHVSYIAWEGDRSLPAPGDPGDFLTMNGDVLTSPGNTVSNNLFNGTNNFEDPVNNELFNADFDDFDISPQIQELENTEGAIFDFFLNSGPDLVFLNTIIIRLPNEAADAIVELPEIGQIECDVTDFTLDFVYSNTDEASLNLPVGVPIRFYLNEIGGTLVGQTTTQVELLPGESDSHQVDISLPVGYLGDFEIIAFIDDPAVSVNSYGQLLEKFEENNTSMSEGFTDRSYSGLNPIFDLCPGDEIMVGSETFDTGGDFPFNLQTVRGGCDSTGIVTIIERPSFDDPPLPLVEVCEGDTITRPTGETQILEPSPTPYVFRDVLTTVFGCDSIVTSTFLVNPNDNRPVVDQEICEGESFQLPGTETLVFDSGVYVSVEEGQAANGCDIIHTTNLIVNELVYPNAFTPDGSGVNDGFKALFPPFCRDFITEYDLKIFNRWGELVFQTNDIEFAWDGDFNSELGQTSFFLWSAEYTTDADISIQKEGGVTLIR